MQYFIFSMEAKSDMGEKDKFKQLEENIEGMDDFVMDDPVKPVKPERRPIPENPFADQIKKATEEVHSTNSEETKTVQNRKKPKMAN